MMMKPPRTDLLTPGDTADPMGGMTPPAPAQAMPFPARKKKKAGPPLQGAIARMLGKAPPTGPIGGQMSGPFPPFAPKNPANRIKP